MPGTDPPPSSERTSAAALRAAFAAAPRELFLPRTQRRAAGQDRALGIGHGQTNSQPSTVRAMLALLDVRPGQRVLDVGSGSGWSTGLLALLVGPQGRVYGVEAVPELVETGRRNLAALALPQARIDPAHPDQLGRPELGPFDRVLVSAQATRVPASLVGQLRVPGVLVVPVHGTMTRVLKHHDGTSVSTHGAYAFVPLREP